MAIWKVTGTFKNPERSFDLLWEDEDAATSYWEGVRNNKDCLSLYLYRMEAPDPGAAMTETACLGSYEAPDEGKDKTAPAVNAMTGSVAPVPVYEKEISDTIRLAVYQYPDREGAGSGYSVWFHYPKTGCSDFRIGARAGTITAEKLAEIAERQYRETGW